jgi:hypothetical protein
MMQKLVFVASLLALSVYGQTTARDLQVFQVPPNAPRLIEVDGIGLTKNNITKTIDAVQFFLNTLGETVIQFNYFTESQNVRSNANPDPLNTGSTQFSIAFRAYNVFEYDNNDGVPGFQETNGPNKDVVTGFSDLGNIFLKWNPIVLQQEVINGVNVTTVTAQTADNVFLIKLVFTGKPVQVGSAQITPNQVKVDFQIQWFNNPLNVKSQWSTGPSNATVHPNAQVGLFAVTAAENAAFSHVNGTNQASITFQRSNFTASFTYANNVTVNVNGVEFDTQVHFHDADTTTNTNVNMDWIGQWDYKITFFSFEATRPSLVYWDPTLGSESQTGSPANPTSPTSAAATTAGAETMSLAVILLFALLSLAL